VPLQKRTALQESREVLYLSRGGSLRAERVPRDDDLDAPAHDRDDHDRADHDDHDHHHTYHHHHADHHHDANSDPELGG
jgi:hypothetical protein